MHASTTLQWLLPVSLTAAFALNCSTAGNSSNSDAGARGDSGTTATGRVPAHHRAASETCSEARPPSGTASGVDAGACNVDGDCKTGKNGRCGYGPTLDTICTYDECSSDGECGRGVCSCRNEAHAKANVCFRGNCATDADCAAGTGYCSPSATDLDSTCVSNVPAGSFGYFCHTAGDTCVDDADCADMGSCVFFVAESRWKCLERRCTN